ncbi:hypothetical protein U1Q18_028216 [Sarracenia purpurea var. burkii]
MLKNLYYCLFTEELCAFLLLRFYRDLLRMEKKKTPQKRKPKLFQFAAWIPAELSYSPISPQIHSLFAGGYLRHRLDPVRTSPSPLLGCTKKTPAHHRIIASVRIYACRRSSRRSTTCPSGGFFSVAVWEPSLLH